MYSTTAGVSPIAEAKRLSGELMPEVELVDRSLRADSLRKKLVLTLKQEDDPKKFLVPTMEYLELKGRGLDAADRQKISNVRRGLVVVMVIPRSNFENNFVLANRFIADVAQRTNAYVADDNTREIFSARSWVDARVGEPSDLLSATKHVTIHAFRSGDYIRAVTVGNNKLGLPDISVSELALSETKPVGDLISALSQRLFEGPVVVRAGTAALQLSELRPTANRRNLNQNLQAGASGNATLCLYETNPQQGDDDNRQLEIGFDSVKGADRHAQRHAFLTSCFGAAPAEILGTRSGDKELLDASGRARDRIAR